MIRTIVTPQNADLHLSIPPNYIGKKLEISLLPIDELIEEQIPKANKMADFWNVMSDESAKKLTDNIKKMRSEWERDI